jgi:hypothetical protein
MIFNKFYKMVTIKSIDDFIKFKEFTTTPLCYVYYKESLLNAYYVGFTTQQGYYYLRNHHKMKRINDVINNGFSIQIYTKYNEDSLINLFKPKLNIQKGTGICGRNIKKQKIQSVGEIIHPFKKYTYVKRQIDKGIYKGLYSIYDNLWDNLFKKNHYAFVSVSIHSDMVNYLIEKEKIKEENKKYNEFYDQFINDEIIVKVFKYKNKTSDLLFGLCSIIKLCKIPKLYASYIKIHEIYFNNIKTLLEEKNINKETLETNRNEWYYLFHSMNNYIKLCNEIIKVLKINNYLIVINENNIKNIMYELSYLYRISIKDHFNDIYIQS